MGEASIYGPAGPEFEPYRDFVFIISGKILKVDFPPKIEYFFLSFSSPTHVSPFYYSILFYKVKSCNLENSKYAKNGLRLEI